MVQYESSLAAQAKGSQQGIDTSINNTTDPSTNSSHHSTQTDESIGNTTAAATFCNQEQESGDIAIETVSILQSVMMITYIHCSKLCYDGMYVCMCVYVEIHSLQYNIVQYNTIQYNTIQYNTNKNTNTNIYTIGCRANATAKGHVEFKLQRSFN